MAIDYQLSPAGTTYCKPQKQEEFYDFCFEEDLPKSEWDVIQYRIPRDQPFFSDWVDGVYIVWDSENLR